MLLDTGAEVTIVSNAFMEQLFPEQELPDHGGEVRSFAGARTAIRGPVPLTLELCGLTMSHSIYFCEGVKTFLLGYDVVSAAALVIDSEARCIYSKFTAKREATQQFVTPSAASDTTPPSATSTSADRPSACDATTTTINDSLPLCVSPRPFHRRLTSLGPSADGPCADSATSTADLGDSTRALTRSTPTAHRNDASTPLHHFLRDSLSLLHPPLHIWMTLLLQLLQLLPVLTNVFAADASSQNEPTEYELDEETQLKVVDLPDQVNVLYVKTLEEVDLPNETTVGLKVCFWTARKRSPHLLRIWVSVRWSSTTLIQAMRVQLNNPQDVRPGKPKTKYYMRC